MITMPAPRGSDLNREEAIIAELSALRVAGHAEIAPITRAKLRLGRSPNHPLRTCLSRNSAQKNGASNSTRVQPGMSML